LAHGAPPGWCALVLQKSAGERTAIRGDRQSLIIADLVLAVIAVRCRLVVLPLDVVLIGASALILVL
jgi:hypothetical protein